MFGLGISELLILAVIGVIMILPFWKIFAKAALCELLYGKGILSTRAGSPDKTSSVVRDQHQSCAGRLADLLLEKRPIWSRYWRAMARKEVMPLKTSVMPNLLSPRSRPLKMMGISRTVNPAAITDNVDSGTNS